MRVRSKFLAALFTTAFLAAPAMAQKSADTLRITMRDALPNVDPYYNNLRTGVVMHHQAWDTLVYRNPDTFKLEPLLASEWKLPDPTTIEFTLRPGVKFHDGTPLTADDVIYTLAIAADPANIPPGCRFHPRCRIAVERCRVEQPVPLARGAPGMVECHLA